MWAFAIWDERLKSLFLSRDRFAEKPLYYFKNQGGFYFSSEIKAIQSMLDVRLEINFDHLKRYLVYGYKFLYKTEDTFFHGIKEIDFASNLTIDSDMNIKESKYWSPNISVANISLTDAIEGSRHHLLNSVQLRLRSDVPIAFCLSGGIDSASLASIAKKVYDYDVTTFSIIDPDQRYNETENIQATIDDLGCNHFLIDLKFDRMLERLGSLVDYHDGPVSTISYLVHNLLSEKISNLGFKIAISGTAADELFTGYYDHFNLHLYEMRNHPDFEGYLNNWYKYTGKNIRNPYLKDPKLYFEDQSIRNHNHLNSDEFESFLKDDFSININESNYNKSLLKNRMLNELFHEGTRVILHEDDLNSMQYSIENRSPYLDIDLFNFALSIPNEHLISDGYAKYILRESVDGILNDKVRLDRKKKGFNASIESVIDLEDKKTIEYILDDSSVYDLIKKDKIEILLKKKEFENSYKKFLFNFLNVKMFMEK
jgi:asparagine synthase (glutamine-hydrolysing)